MMRLQRSWRNIWENNRIRVPHLHLSETRVLFSHTAFIKPQSQCYGRLRRSLWQLSLSLLDRERESAQRERDVKSGGGVRIFSLVTHISFTINTTFISRTRFQRKGSKRKKRKSSPRHPPPACGRRLGLNVKRGHFRKRCIKGK